MALDKVIKHLEAVERKLGKANKIAAKGDDMKLNDAMKLGRKINSIISTIKKSIKDYDGTDPSAKESQDVLDQVKRIVNLSETQVSHLLTNKAYFEKLHVGGLIKRQLSRTEEVSEELAALCLSKAPENLKAEAEALHKEVQDMFAKAKAGYANATGGEDAADAHGEDDSD